MSVAREFRKRSFETVGLGRDVLSVQDDSRPSTQYGAKPAAIGGESGYESQDASLPRQSDQLGATLTGSCQRAATGQRQRPALAQLSLHPKKERVARVTSGSKCNSQ